MESHLYITKIKILSPYLLKLNFMKTFKLCLSIFLFLISFTAINAQKASAEDKAKENTEKLNQKLKAINESLVLTADQNKAVYEAYLNGEKAMAEARKSATTDEEKKEKQQPIRKEMNANIRKNILSKEQRTALNESSSKDKK